MHTVVLADINIGFIALAIVIAILFVGLLVSSFGRKSSREGTGMLARETYQRDKSSQVEVAEELGSTTGREIEPAARIERIGGELVPKEKGDLAPFVPPD